VVPHSALQPETAKIVATPEKEKQKKRKPEGKGRDLENYSYNLSMPELARVRQENPSASKTVARDDDRAVPLSWEEYNDLSKQQRAAVDFNTLLVQAREVDLKTDPKFFSPAEKAQYDKDVKAMFGELGGSETIGYHTVELLKKIDFTAVGQDLDEFLSLERAISTDELKNFKFSKDEVQQMGSFSIGALMDPAKAVADYTAARTPANIAAINTDAIKKTLSAYKGVLTKGGANAWNIESALGISMPMPMMAPAGYGRDPVKRKGETTSKFQVDAAIEELYGTLSAYPTEQGLAAIFQDFKQWDWTPEEQQQFWDYTNDRSLREIQYLDNATARQIRDALGWK
jgi:hypothetical protein